MLRLACLTTFLVCCPVFSAWSADAPKVGDAAPDFALKNALGQTIKLSSYRNQKPVVLVFSRAQWCPYCIGHMKALQSRYAEIRNAGAEVVAVFREDQDQVEGLKKIQSGTKAEFVLLTDYRAEQTKAYSPEGYAAYVIDAQGVIRAIVPGTKAGRPDIDKLLAAVKSSTTR